MLAALPAFWWLGRLPRGPIFVAGGVALFALSLLGGREMLWRQPESVRSMARADATQEDFAAGVERHVPAGALLYTESADKLTWARRETASMPFPPWPVEHTRVAASMDSAIAERGSVYVVQPQWDAGRRLALTSALHDRGLNMLPVSRSGTGSVWRVQRGWAPPPVALAYPHAAGQLRGLDLLVARASEATHRVRFWVDGRSFGWTASSNGVFVIPFQAGALKGGPHVLELQAIGEDGSQAWATDRIHIAAGTGP
jgi:hypothetical protein